MKGQCPMFDRKNTEKLTELQIARFCALGCSVDCDKLLQQYLKKLPKRNIAEGSVCYDEKIGSMPILR